jgi:hypothetical protein
LFRRTVEHVHDDTRKYVDDWWRDVFEVREELWSSVTVVHPHGHLGDYEGWYVAWREDGVHVSAPSSAEATEIASLRHERAASLQVAEFWQAFANQHGMELIGPSTHSYLDLDPGPVDGVVELTADDLEQLRLRVHPKEWTEGGMADDPPPSWAFGMVEQGKPVAAAVLNLWAGTARDIGVVVAEGHRGRGLSARVGGAAASYAVREHGIARWRAATTNIRSLRTALRLGFEPYATQLAVRHA